MCNARIHSLCILVLKSPNNCRLKAATQLNENVYHDLIPGIDGLEPVQPVELVKPVVFKPTDPSCVGTDIFSRLVPMRAYEAASLYRCVVWCTGVLFGVHVCCWCTCVLFGVQVCWCWCLVYRCVVWCTGVLFGVQVCCLVYRCVGLCTGVLFGVHMCCLVNMCCSV